MFLAFHEGAPNFRQPPFQLAGSHLGMVLTYEYGVKPATRSPLCENRKMRNLGLIGGMGPGSTVIYYQELARAGAGEMLLIHADIDYVLTAVAAGNHIALAGYFARLIERLARGGATLAAISAVTPHACIRELEKITPLPPRPKSVHAGIGAWRCSALASWWRHACSECWTASR
jgi:hypothetical protein